MRRPSPLFALPLLVVLLSCAAPQDEGLGAEPVQAGAQEPVQLAEYPGAPFETRSGVLWFATVLKGLIRYDGHEFVTFSTEDGLAGNTVRGLVEDDNGALWIGTNAGVSIFDGESFTTLTDYGDIPVTRTFSKEGDHRDVWEVFKDRKGDFWITTMDGVFRYDGAAFTPFPMPAIAGPGKFEFAPKMVYSIYEDRDGALWFGTDGAGVVRYDGSELTTFTVEANGLCSDRVCTILQDGRRDFWFGTSDGGVSRWDGRAFTTHLRSETRSIHTGWGRYMAIAEDRHGDVWFGVSSAGGGVHRWDGRAFRTFTEADGLGSGGVPSIREDRQGNLWFGTTAGVFRFDGVRFINFTEAHPDAGKRGGGEEADAASVKD